jgi:hypothetical protein
MGGDYHAVTGTSAAAPLVTGIAGLIKSSYPGLSAVDTRASILTGARHVTSLSGKVVAGGTAQASGALGKASSLSYVSGGGNGNGNGNNGNGNGGESGGGNGGWHSRSPRPGRPERGSGGHGTGGSFHVAPPEVIKGAPGRNLPNLDEVRKLKSHVPQPTPGSSTTISANLLCADCDAGTGGGYVPPGDPLYARARMEPRNETGQAGVDLGSQNFNWNTSLRSFR